MLVQLDRAARFELTLAIGLRHLLERVHPRHRIAGLRDLGLEADHELLPHLRACGQPAQRFGDFGEPGSKLGDPLPRVDRARDVAHPELGELRDFFEPAHLIIGFGAGLARVVEREFVEPIRPRQSRRSRK